MILRVCESSGKNVIQNKIHEMFMRTNILTLINNSKEYDDNMFDVFIEDNFNIICWFIFYLLNH